MEEAAVYEVKRAITNENYFDPDMNERYMSTSQFKRFIECEALAYAELTGKWTREETKALMVGKFIDAHFEGTLDIFRAQNPEIYQKSGKGLLKDYVDAEYIIQRIERDPLFMKYMGGKKQIVKTGFINGVEWKIKIDSYLEGEAIVDLKTSAEIGEVWKDGRKQHFIKAYRYDFQGAVYQAVEGDMLPVILAVVSKEKEPNIELYELHQQLLNEALDEIIARQDRFVDIKKGKIAPHRCGECDYCKSTKVLTEVKIFTGNWEDGA